MNADHEIAIEPGADLGKGQLGFVLGSVAKFSLLKAEALEAQILKRLGVRRRESPH